MCRRVIRSSRGLIPYWCQDPKGGREPINIECEMVHTCRRIRASGHPRRTKALEPPIIAPQHVEALASERTH
jgi:hypothetical protein